MPPPPRTVLRWSYVWVLGALGALALPPEDIPSMDRLPQEIANYTRPLVSKCCSLNYGYTFENRSVCVDTEEEFVPEFEDRADLLQVARTLPVEDRFEYFIGDPCSEGKYILDRSVYSYDDYFIYSNGTLLYLDDLYSKEDFCLETLNGTVRAFICFRGPKMDTHTDSLIIVIYAVGLIISIPFLLATAFIYLSFEMFRDLRGKSLSCYVLCLAIGYIVLVIVQLGSDALHEDLCIAAGFIIQFFFVASFFWLNVISYDTFRCINNDFQCPITPANLESEKITFWCYSLYGWYGPIMLSIATIVMNFEPAIPESFVKPNIGLKSCWFYSDDAALPYFYGPVGIVILVNIILFALSARKIYKEHKRRVRSSRTSTQRDTHPSIRLYIKVLQECIYLFAIMGINWTAEVISWSVGGSQAIWLVTDIFNALQGLMIFYLFVVRPRRIREGVKKELREMWKRVVKCDCGYREERKRDSRHWHANIQKEVEEWQVESDKFLEEMKSTSV